MSTNRKPDGGSPGDDESDHSEGYDTLAPLPDDLLVHPHEIDDVNIQNHPLPHHHRSPLPEAGAPFTSSSSTPQPLPATQTTATSKRRTVEPGSTRPIFPVRNPTKEDIIHARKMLTVLQKEHGFTVPDRGNMDDPSIMWKEGKPDYTITDLHYFLGKTKNHKPGSLEEFVENFIKTWEMEATHKEFYQWTTVDQSAYEVQSNGGKIFDSVEAPWVGNYNWLLSTCDKELYDSTKETFESSHGKFRYVFLEGFPFEVLEVFSGPPKVVFTWRHWAVFSGEWEGHKGSGETINMTGIGVVTLNEENKAKKIEIHHDPDYFLRVLRGEAESRDGINKGMAVGEAIAGGLETLTCLMADIELEERTGKSEEGKDNNVKGESSSGSRCPFTGLSKSDLKRPPE